MENNTAPSWSSASWHVSKLSVKHIIRSKLLFAEHMPLSFNTPKLGNPPIGIVNV